MIIHNSTIDRLIDINKGITSDRGKTFYANREILNEIVQKINLFADVVDPRLRVARQVANILSSVICKRPFKHENAETSLIWAISFIKESGFNISSSKMEELFDVIIISSKEEDRIRQQAEMFLKDNII